MQLKIRLELNGSIEILKVELLDNPGVQKWTEHVKKLTANRTVTTQPITSELVRSLSQESDLWTQQQLVQQQLSVTNLPIPMPVDSPEQITRQHLNIWHRWFTHHTREYPPTSTVEYHWLHELNQIVHELEQCFRSWPHPQLGVRGYEMDFATSVDEHGVGPDFVDLTPYREYHSWESADLILDQTIHGKTTMQSFLDNDDPKNWDTTGHHMSWGGCKLVNSQHRQEIYQDKLFRQWMDQNNVTHNNLFGDFPLGNIANRDQSTIDRIFKFFETSHVKSEKINYFLREKIIARLTILD